jgi:biopolymer transport protein ExbD
MGHIAETGTGKSRNVELNIVPFIDLMSCLTAFLLVTAVWIPTAQLEVEPKGKAKNAPECLADPEICDPVRLSVLVEPERIWIGLSRVNEFEKIEKLEAGHDWDKLEERLRHHKASAFFADKTDIEVAAQSTTAAPVQYQALIAAMDVAVKVGFIDVGLTDPNGLSARPTL